MSSLFESAIRAPAVATLAQPPGRTYRILIGSAILLGLALVLYATLSGELFRPVREAIASGDWPASMLRPSLLWGGMAVLMLTQVDYRTRVTEPALMQPPQQLRNADHGATR